MLVEHVRLMGDGLVEGLHVVEVRIIALMYWNASVVETKVKLNQHILSKYSRYREWFHIQYYGMVIN